MNATKITALLNNFEFAVREDAFAGAADPQSRPVIEFNLSQARTALLVAIGVPAVEIVHDSQHAEPNRFKMVRTVDGGSLVVKEDAVKPALPSHDSVDKDFDNWLVEYHDEAYRYVSHKQFLMTTGFMNEAALKKNKGIIRFDSGTIAMMRERYNRHCA